MNLAIAAFGLTVMAWSQPLAQVSQGVGVAVWARHHQGMFIAGLDGALYDPYPAATIRRVQQALRRRGLYTGPTNGILDSPTMKSIYAFQQANSLQPCGVPTPHTRTMLEQGSHTDLSFRSKVNRERTATYRAVRSGNGAG